MSETTTRTRKVPAILIDRPRPQLGKVLFIGLIGALIGFGVGWVLSFAGGWGGGGMPSMAPETWFPSWVPRFCAPGALLGLVLGLLYGWLEGSRPTPRQDVVEVESRRWSVGSSVGADRRIETAD
ncbi:MAG: hypothetical protein AAF533_11615 [Acidobacteriota bacterium]